MTQVTEPLRAEHRGLLPELESLVAIAESLDDWEKAVTPGQLTEVIAFLRDRLVPHARAEEAVLYPAIERAMGSPRATATMVADHTEIVRRIDALGVTTAAVGVRPPSAHERNELRAELFGLWAILRLHFDKEEQVLLPRTRRTPHSRRSPNALCQHECRGPPRMSDAVARPAPRADPSLSARE